jgi:hypothetical protein
MAMHSACGEYNCDCHYNLPDLLDDIDELSALCAGGWTDHGNHQRCAQTCQPSPCPVSHWCTLPEGHKGECVWVCRLEQELEACQEVADHNLEYARGLERELVAARAALEGRG